jgi:NAD(P)H-dependent flavin oxidoreductase YrpB (nitropropane dioxygenase family)
MRTAFTDLVGVPHPIVGFNRSPGVVAAVTNAGGFGVLGASAYTPAELDAQLTWIEERTGGKPYGVDLLVPEKFAAGDPDNLVASLRAQIPAGHLAFVADLLDRYGIPETPLPAGRAAEHDEIAASLNPAGAAALLDIAFGHRISLIASALGPPPPDLVARAKAAGVAVAALVGQPKHAVRQIEAGVDLLIAQGTEAGGHTGTIATMVLTPEIVDIAAGRPVLAAGGIASGRQMAAALALGASGVWCGSVWLCSVEDVANQAIKDKFLQATHRREGAHRPGGLRPVVRLRQPGRHHQGADGRAVPAGTAGTARGVRACPGTPPRSPARGHDQPPRVQEQPASDGQRRTRPCLRRLLRRRRPVVAILTGAWEKAFSAGNDLIYSASGRPMWVPKNGFAGLTSRASMPKPVIAAVNGFSMGGGCEIALACHLVVADATAQFALSEVRVGLVAGAGGLIRLPRTVPPKVGGVTGNRPRLSRRTPASLPPDVRSPRRARGR